VSEKSFKARTQVVQTLLTVRSPDEAVLRASAVTQGKDLALPTVARQRIPLGLPKLSLGRVLQHFDQRGLADIPQAIFRVDEVIAGIKVPIVFDHGDIAACLPKDAKRMLHPASRSGRLIEYLHHDLSNIVPNPLVEDCTQKRTISFSRNCVFTHSVLPPLDQGKKRQVLASNLLKEPVNRCGGMDVLIMDHAKEIA
jgi:hypothetical protein